MTWVTAKPRRRKSAKQSLSASEQFRCISLEDLYQKASGIWAYCTYQWARFCEQPFDRDNRHQDRARIIPWWKEVQAVSWDDLHLVTRKKPLAQKDKKMLRDMMGGCALNIAAFKMANSKNIIEIITAKCFICQGSLRGW